MSSKLQLDNSVRIISNAFLPFEVIVTTEDFGAKFEFRVLDEAKQSVLNVVDLSKQQVTNPGRLQYILESSRRSLTERGLNLNAWLFSQALETSNLPLER